MEEYNLKVNKETINIIGTVCDAALKAGGLSIINEVNKLLNSVNAGIKEKEDKNESK